jgi:hypothetical protein
MLLRAVLPKHAGNVRLGVPHLEGREVYSTFFSSMDLPSSYTCSHGCGTRGHTFPLGVLTMAISVSARGSALGVRACCLQPALSRTPASGPRSSLSRRHCPWREHGPAAYCMTRDISASIITLVYLSFSLIPFSTLSHCVCQYRLPGWLLIFPLNKFNSILQIYRARGCVSIFSFLDHNDLVRFSYAFLFYHSGQPILGFYLSVWKSQIYSLRLEDIVDSAKPP